MIRVDFLQKMAGSDELVKKTLELAGVDSNELIKEYTSELSILKGGLSDREKAIFLILSARLTDTDEMYLQTKGSLTPFIDI